MTPSLRSLLVEAGARALHERVAEREGWANKSFDAIPEVAQDVYREWSADLLSVYLDTLTENADEWAKRADGWIDDSVAKDLLAVLRNPE